MCVVANKAVASFVQFRKRIAVQGRLLALRGSILADLPLLAVIHFLRCFVLLAYFSLIFCDFHYMPLLLTVFTHIVIYLIFSRSAIF